MAMQTVDWYPTVCLDRKTEFLGNVVCDTDLENVIGVMYPVVSNVLILKHV